MLEQISNSIKATLYDRVSSPLSSSFIISWCLWNYKILIVLFSSMKPYEKYNAIDILLSTTVLQTSFYEPLGYWLTNGVVFPLLSALVYIYIYPIPAKVVYKHYLRVQGDLKEKRNEIERNELLTLDDSLTLRQEILNKDKYYIEIINSKNRDIEKSGSDIKALLSDLSDIRVKNKELLDKMLEINNSIQQKESDYKTLEEKYKLVEIENVELKNNVESLESNLNTYRGMQDSEEAIKMQYTKHRNMNFKNQLSFEIFSTIVKNANVRGDGTIMEREIYKYVDTNKWSTIAVDAAMNSIKDNGLIRIYPTSKTINLTDKGKEVAVNCGLA